MFKRKSKKELKSKPSSEQPEIKEDCVHEEDISNMNLDEYMKEMRRPPNNEVEKGRPLSAASSLSKSFRNGAAKYGASDEQSLAEISTAFAAEDDFGESFEEYSKSSAALQLSFLCFFLYFLASTIAFSVQFEHWTVIDSIYMAVVTFTSCGYGDLTPKEGDTAGLIFTTIYVLVGVLVIATIAFNILFVRVFGGYEEMVNSAKAESSEKYMAKFETNRLDEQSEGGGNRNGNENGNESDNLIDKKEANVNVDEDVNVDKDVEQNNDEKSDSIGWELVEIMKGALPLFLFKFAVTYYIGYSEGWTIAQSVYFLAVTATTVGYGDFAPTLQRTRLICIFFIPFCVGVVAETFARLAGAYTTRKAIEAEETFLNRRLTYEDVKRMDKDGDKEVSELEFVQFMLIRMGKVTPEDFKKVQTIFHSLDKTGDGSLSLEDVLMLATGPIES
jgi:hypothetical protein